MGHFYCYSRNIPGHFPDSLYPLQGLVELLLRAGANPNLVDGAGKSALHWAVGALSGSVAQLHLLVEHGADLDMRVLAAWHGMAFDC